MLYKLIPLFEGNEWVREDEFEGDFPAAVDGVDVDFLHQRRRHQQFQEEARRSRKTSQETAERR